MLNRRFMVPATAALVALTFVACQDGGLAPEEVDAPEFRKAGGSGAAVAIGAMMDEVNVALAAQGANYRVAMAEYVTGDGDEAGATVISKDVGNKQLTFDFVPFDARRLWSGSVAGPTDDITYAVDQTGDAVPPFGGLTGAATTAAIDAAMGTWDGQRCSTLPITKNPDFGIDIGVVAFILGLGGSPFVVADVQHAGWRDINFGGGVLGATFTFGFTDGPRCAADDRFSDIDGNGKCDTAFREIYYDPSFNWADDGVSSPDVETVALHEVGHGLSQAHFGNIFFNTRTGAVIAAPRAIMNPFIFGVDRNLLASDDGGHCSIWGQWPSN